MADRFHDLKVDAEQIVAAHAGLTRHAGGDDDHVGALDHRIIVRAAEAHMKTLLRGRLREVESFSLRDAFGDVEEGDVPEFLQGGNMGERTADLAGADQRDLLT